MKRILVLLAVAAGLLAAATPASAASVWKGTVVAKDNGRSAVVTASANGVVRTARSPKARSLQIGQRLTVSGTKLADGTFKAATLRLTGRAKSARVKAVVVRYQRAGNRLLVSAGGSTFALPRRTSQRALATASAETPAAGDQIVATVSVATGTPQATSVTTVGHLGTLEVEGILTKAAGGSIELVVARAGFVTIAVPAGFALPAALKIFDDVKIIVSVATDGKLTLVAIQGDKAHEGNHEGVEHDEDEDEHELEVAGAISALSDSSITVTLGSTASPVTCALHRPLTGFAVGDRVQMACATAAPHVLKEIEHEDEDHEEDEHEDAHDDDDDHDDDHHDD